MTHHIVIHRRAAKDHTTVDGFTTLHEAHHRYMELKNSGDFMRLEILTDIELEPAPANSGWNTVLAIMFGGFIGWMLVWPISEAIIWLADNAPRWW